MINDWERIINDLLSDKNVDLTLDLKISAHLMKVGLISKNQKLIQKSKENFKSRLNEVDRLIMNSLNHNFNSESSIIEFYSSMVNKFEIIVSFFSSSVENKVKEDKSVHHSFYLPSDSKKNMELLLEKINPVKAVAKNNPPSIDDIPIFRKFL